MTTTLRPLTALALLAMIVAGCSNAPGGTANSNGNGTTVHAKAVKFAECMRNHGVDGFPDPAPSGTLIIDGVVNGSSLNPDSQVFKQAVTACKGLEPPGFTGSKVTPAQRTARLAFAECMRESGVPDFPDPTPNGPLVDTYRIPSSNTAAGMTILNAAMHKCGARYSGRLGLNGQ